MNIFIHPRANLLERLSEHDIDVATRTIVGEARGEDFAGQLAVANVLLTRMLADWHGDGKPDWWGEGLAGVCLAPWQFSCWNVGDPNRPKILGMKSSSPEYRRAQAILLLAANGDLIDNAPKCTHYHHDTLAKPTSWLKGPPLEVYGNIGRHRFYYFLDATIVGLPN